MLLLRGVLGPAVDALNASYSAGNLRRGFERRLVKMIRESACCLVPLAGQVIFAPPEAKWVATACPCRTEDIPFFGSPGLDPQQEPT